MLYSPFELEHLTEPYSPTILLRKAVGSEKLTREMAGDEHHSDTSEVDVDRNCTLFPPNKPSKSPDGLLVDFQFCNTKFDREKEVMTGAVMFFQSC